MNRDDLIRLADEERVARGNGRADVELTVQIGANGSIDADEEVLSILTREAARRARQLVRKVPKAERVHEEQFSTAVLRVTLRRPHLSRG